MIPLPDTIVQSNAPSHAHNSGSEGSMTLATRLRSYRRPILVAVA
jgi:hypothetical protein